ncbi:MAG: short-chain dehydrogenase [Euryarchaeota archaeon]|mgnify:CR=1 FL=1|nr:short-chain dehydrogenase [Euryarchaeota archaeon]|tara:strand:- start:619 stop:1512 length:894 start_codon:yes stop_codon:yes gene_type:complete
MVKGLRGGGQISDLSGKVVLLTGATRGIGRKAAHGIAPTGATIVVVGRDKERVDMLISELEQIEGCGPVHGEICDLLVQKEIRSLADRFNNQFDRLDVLINNAGAIFTKKITTVDGFERTWALNHNAYFLLTSLLKDKLLTTPDSRVISTASDAHVPGRMGWDDLQYERRGNRNGWSSYCQSKLANILFTKELAKKLEGTSVTANCIHPGFVNTGFSRNNGIIGRLLMALTWPVQRNSTKGAETIVWLAISDKARQHNGDYLYNCKLGRLTKAAKNEEDAARLWLLSEEMTGTSGVW